MKVSHILITVIDIFLISSCLYHFRKQKLIWTATIKVWVPTRQKKDIPMIHYLNNLHLREGEAAGAHGHSTVTWGWLDTAVVICVRLVAGVPNDVNFIWKVKIINIRDSDCDSLHYIIVNIGTDETRTCHLKVQNAMNYSTIYIWLLSGLTMEETGNLWILDKHCCTHGTLFYTVI